MPNERHYNELNLESVGINLPYTVPLRRTRCISITARR